MKMGEASSVNRVNVNISYGTTSGYSSKSQHKGKSSDQILSAAMELISVLHVDGRLPELKEKIKEYREKVSHE